MVTIVDYKTYQKENGEDFHALVVQGGLEAVKSKETNRVYFTAKTARVSCTFGEEMCKKLLGTEMPGSIAKIEVDPYEYAIPDTGEIIHLSHRNEYVSEEDAVIKEQVADESVVA
jgi:hypothetical protein